MNSSYDTIIVGAGLAGACAAFYRSEAAPVLLIDEAAHRPCATGAAAGLVNPIMGRRARKSWKADEALDALSEMLGRSGTRRLFSADGVLRPALSEEQAADFREAARAYGSDAEWLAPGEASERFPHVSCTHGALMVRRGGAVVFPELVTALISSARGRGNLETAAARITDFGSEEGTPYVESESGRRWRARRLVLAVGAGYTRFPRLNRLALHRVKGQVLEASPPPGLPRLPCISGLGYIAPAGENYMLGSSYEHAFSDLDPNPAETRAILARAAAMVPALGGRPVLGVRVGVRVTVPGIRLPMAGPLPEMENVWLLTGLGSRGLLLAPLLARRLNAWLDGTAPPWEECAVREG